MPKRRPQICEMIYPKPKPFVRRKSPRAADFEKALAKLEALCAEMVATISERDQTIAKLQADLAGNKSLKKKATTQGEVSATTSSWKIPLADQSSELKKRDDQIAELRVQL
jgi:hypothetical protein